MQKLLRFASISHMPHVVAVLVKKKQKTLGVNKQPCDNTKSSKTLGSMLT
jgi:hypothetical protein